MNNRPSARPQPISHANYQYPRAHTRWRPKEAARRRLAVFPSPRDLVNVDASSVFTGQIATEDALKAAWGDRFRATKDKELVAKLVALGKAGKPKPSVPVSPRLPSSSTASRTSHDFRLSEAPLQEMIASVKSPRMMPTLYQPLSAAPANAQPSPRGTLPSYYGNSLHSAVGAMGFDARSK